MPQIIELERKWHIGNQIGQGGFGKVYLAKSDDGKLAVVKLIPKDPGADRELLFVNLNNVPNVMPVIDSGEWENFWVIVMPKADKSLRDYLNENIGQLTIDDSVRVLADILEALVALGGKIIHRDIKPENILLLDDRWQLTDFGISKYAEATTAVDTKKYAMTPPYADPEQWRNEQATSATDVYALGVVAYEILAGFRPFKGPEIHNYRQQHLGVIPVPIQGIPVRLQSLIDESLNKSPGARPLPQNLLHRLQANILPTSEAAQKLQQANAMVVRQQAETARLESIAKSEAERRHELANASKQALMRVLGQMDAQIIEYAPTCKPSKERARWSWSLNEAELRVEFATIAGKSDRDGYYSSPIDVVAYSRITLRKPANQFGYEGRAHSLWYCDAKDAGVFRWYETSFMGTFGAYDGDRISPFSLDPGNQDAYYAISQITHTVQVAWPFTPFDQGDEGEFIERWIGWLADAAQGNLNRPSSMPERSPRGSWRARG